MGEWTALAEQLADDLREPGFGAAAVNASAWCSRVDASATRGLVGAALALTCGEALNALYERRERCDMKTLVSWAEELEAHVAALLKRCMDLGRAVHGEHRAAARARNMALAGASAATTEDAKAAALAQAEEAERVMADCEAALEVLGDADCSLRYARDLLRAVPGELTEVYEAPIALTARGGRMPHSGDFIAPSGPAETITERGAA